MWQPNRSAKKNLKTSIKIAHAARQNIPLSIVVDFKTLKTVFFKFNYSSVRLRGLERCVLIKNGEERRKNNLDGFRRWSANGTVFIIDFKTLKPFSFQLSILTHISSSLPRFTRVHFDKGWSEEKKKLARSFWPTVYGDRRHFELC